MKGEQKTACEFEKVTYLGYPFSISENFQMRNTHKTIADSIRTLDYIINISENTIKKWLSTFQWVLETPMVIPGILKLF